MLFRVVRISCGLAALMLGFSCVAQAQGRVCPAVALSSAALSSKGELGIGQTFELVPEPRFEWSKIRTVRDPTACFVAEANALMKASCTAFLARQEVLGNQTAIAACSLEQKALDMATDENLRLKRVIRRLKSRLNRS
jgi:hypothetical protein